jgi:histidinol-phosphate aminotransferase
MEIQELLRPHIARLVPYSSARDEYSGSEGVFLDANENPFNLSNNFILNRYPDPYQKELKSVLAQIKGVKPEQIFLGNGSDEGIDLLFRAFCDPTDNVIILPPTYGMYEVSANIQNVEIQKINLTPDFQIDVAKTLAAINSRTKLLFICSPNNPSGNCIDKESIFKILDNFKGITVLDEAYIDFCPSQTFMGELKKYPRLAILQTLSKAWGLAGIRLGMLFASAEIISVFNKIKLPYNLNIVTQEIVKELLLAKQQEKNEMVKELSENKDFLREQLSKLPFVEKIYPSDANFLLVKMINARKVFDDLISQKIIVRDRSKVVLCDNCLRISVGMKAENEKLIQKMQEIK